MIYVVTAVFNRKEMTERHLKALRDQTKKEIQLVLVDDNSTDGTVEMAKTIFPNMHVVQGTGDWWWTRSMMEGIEYVKTVAKDGDYVLCINNDQIPEPDSLTIAIHTSEKYGRAIVGSISREFNNKKHIFDSAYSINWKKLIYSPIPLKDKGEYAGDDIDVLTCRFTLVPFEVFQVVQFDGKRFPHYLGDYDLFLQAKKAGFKLILSYDIKLYDIGGKSGITAQEKHLSLKKVLSNMFSTASHNQVWRHTKYIFKNSPKLRWKAKLIFLLWGYYAFLIAKAIFIVPFIRKTPHEKW